MATLKEVDKTGYRINTMQRLLPTGRRLHMPLSSEWGEQAEYDYILKTTSSPQGASKLKLNLLLRETCGSDVAFARSQS